jgi:hypothetical protein
VRPNQVIGDDVQRLTGRHWQAADAALIFRGWRCNEEVTPMHDHRKPSMGAGMLFVAVKRTGVFHVD